MLFERTTFSPLFYRLHLPYYSANAVVSYSAVAGGGEQAQAGTVSTCMQSLLCETNIQCNSILRTEYSDGISYGFNNSFISDAHF